MKSRMILLVMIVLMAFFAAGCGMVGPTDPDKPDPKPPFVEKRYTVKVEYIRVDVKRPDLMWRLVGLTIYDPNLQKSLVTDLMTKKDDYHSEMTCSDTLETESYNSYYCIFGKDAARLGETDDTCIVGDRFILTTFNEDGSIISTLELNQYRLEQCPHQSLQGSQCQNGQILHQA